MTEKQIPDWADSNLSKELSVLRARGENQDLEYMESFPENTHELAKEIAAFATSNPGTILIGVSDDGVLKGIDDTQTSEERDNYLRRIEGVCRGTVKPSIIPTVKYVYEDGNTVIALFIPKGTQPVYYSGGKPYIRNITESRPAEPHEVIELIRKWLPPDQIGEEEIDPFSQLISELSSVIIEILIYGEEAEQRDCNPWLDQWRSQFAFSAKELRDIAVNDFAIQKKLADKLIELANILDHVASLTLTTGSWQELKDNTSKAVEKAAMIRAIWINTKTLSGYSLVQVKKLIVESARKLTDICIRAKDSDYVWRNADDFQAEVSGIGYSLLRVSYYNLNGIKEDLGIELKIIARNLHLIEIIRLYMDGGNSIRQLVQQVQECSDELNKITSTIPTNSIRIS